MRKLNQRSHFFRVLPVLLTFFFLQTMLIVQAQQRQITGTVKDAKGSPVALVTVAVKGGLLLLSLLKTDLSPFPQKMAIYLYSAPFLLKRLK